MALRKDTPSTAPTSGDRKKVFLGMKVKPPKFLPVVAVGAARVVGGALAWYASGYETMKNEALLTTVPWHMFIGLGLARMLYDISTQTSIRMRSHAECRWPDQAVYTTENGELVLMDTEGTKGDFNRAMRVCGNYSEYISYQIAFYVVASLYYPMLGALGMAGWLLGRSAYLVQYTNDRTTKSRLHGFMFSNVFGLSFLEGVLYVIAAAHYKAQA